MLILLLYSYLDTIVKEETDIQTRITPKDGKSGVFDADAVIRANDCLLSIEAEQWCMCLHTSMLTSIYRVYSDKCSFFNQSSMTGRSSDYGKDCIQRPQTT